MIRLKGTKKGIMIIDDTTGTEIGLFTAKPTTEWTHRPPTVPGWYWVLAPPSDRPFLKLVYSNGMGGLNTDVPSPTFGKDVSIRVDARPYLWAGPVPKPDPPAKKYHKERRCFFCNSEVTPGPRCPQCGGHTCHKLVPDAE